MVGVADPLQVIGRSTILPAARLKGAVIRDPIKYASSGLTSSYFSKSPKGKGKEKMVETEKFKLLSSVQTQIDLLVDEVNEYADTKTENYVDWYQYWTVTFAKTLKRKETLKKFIVLEKIVMKVVKAVTIVHAMEKKEYFYDLMRIKKLSAVCEGLKKNYDPTCPTVHDDRTTFTELDTDLISLQRKVEFWEMDQ